ncbi:Hypothetical predicted protein [Lecanosticta acicola]|uniref:F-box domain-containing protein n=1 Tax=Lecanosticta acicola TaxID=111012 RepID=A0AAI8YY44_9PEZI|nr:Hypothetical predicted protein [Lecanosticta acicola]
MAVKLCDLANEVLSLIAEQLEGDTESLQALRGTSSRFRAIAEPVLYRHLFFRDYDKITSLVPFLLQPDSPSRLKAVHSIDARPQEGGHRAGPEHLVSILGRTPNLKELTFEMAGINQRLYKKGAWSRFDERDILAPIIDSALSQEIPSAPPARTLPVLKKLTLHLSGNSIRARYWNIDDESCRIFAHPSIEEMHLSCANITRDFQHVLLRFGKTPLKRLTLTECDIGHTALSALLEKPRALEYLYLGESANHYGQRSSPENYLLERNATAFLAALGQQKHSLKQFCYRPKGVLLSVTMPDDAGLSSFEVLDTVSMECAFPELQEMITSEKTRPPNLTTINLRDYHGAIQNQSSLMNHDLEEDNGNISPLMFLCQRTSKMKSLKQINVTTNDIFGNGTLPVPEQVVVEGAELSLQPRGVRLTVSCRAYPHSAIPPYLEGEPTPTDQLVFDSQLPGGWLDAGCRWSVLGSSGWTPL